MLEIYNSIIENSIKYNGSIRKDVEENFIKLANAELESHVKIMGLLYEVGQILKSNIPTTYEESKIYYTYLFHIKIIDHFTTSTFLFSKGYTVDAITILRSAVEDLTVVLNIWLNQGYFEEWLEGKKIVPRELRNFDGIDEYTRELFNNIYGDMSNITHPRINSIMQMAKFHPQFGELKDDKFERIIKDFGMQLGLSMVYLVEVQKILTDNFDDENINLLVPVLDEIFKDVAGLLSQS